MSRIPNIGAGPAATGSTSNSTNQFGDLEVQDFLDLMITELSNQDPLNPMDNQDLVVQINQIRESGATDKLTETLEAVLTGSNLTAASSMIGKQVKALSDSTLDVEGTVERVTIDVDEESEERSYRLQVRDGAGVEHAVNLRNVREVLSQ